MDTARYLSVCLNTLNLPLVLQNDSHEVTKYLQKLSTIPTSMQLADGFSLQTHLELMVEANPSQKYLLSKQGYSFENFKAEVLKFQKSKGYSDLLYEYKAVGTDITRPHHFLQHNVPIAPPTTPIPVSPEMPKQLIEQPAPEEPSVPPTKTEPSATSPQTQSQGQPRPNHGMTAPIRNIPLETKADTTQTPENPTPTVQPTPLQQTPIQRSPIRSRTLPPTVVAPPPARATFKQPLPQPIRASLTPAQGQARPNRNIPPLTLPQPIASGLKSAGSGLGIFTQRATNVTVPKILGGFVKSTGSALLGFIPGASAFRDGGSSGTMSLLRSGGSGGGRASFIRQAVPLPSGGRSWMWILLLLLLLILFFVLFYGGDILSNNADIKNIEITKTAPQAVDNGSKITYTITVRNKGTKTAQVVVSDDIPENTTYESGNNDPVTSDPGKEVKSLRWSLNSLAGGQVSLLNFSVIPTKDDTWIINQAKATVAIGAGGSTGGPVNIPGNIPPTQDNCGGKYTFKTPLGNYGDPQCNFNKDDLFTLLKQLDPQDANTWFYDVIRCESGYDPNNFLGASASGLGAYGLFQMNPSGKGNGPLDAGDVIWQLQSSNAINYSKQIPNKWGYWACAMHLW